MDKTYIAVTGGRDFWGFRSLSNFLDMVVAWQKEEGKEIIGIFEGGATGADQMAAEWAKKRNLEIQTIAADWSKGKKAGPERNLRMLKELSRCGGDLLVSFPGGKGTQNAIEEARKLEISVVSMGEDDYIGEEKKDYLDSLSLLSLFDVEKDGTTHINFYSKAVTNLGRYLSNFTKTPDKIITPYGEFQSIEGLWFYLKLLNVDVDGKDALHHLFCYKAKDVGGELLKKASLLRYQEIYFETFKEALFDAILQKINRAPNYIKEELRATAHLPFVHYYVYGGKAIPAGYDFLRTMMEDIREIILQ